MKKKKTIGILLIVIAVISIGIFAFLKRGENPKEKNGKMVEAYQVEGSDSLFLNGKIEPEESQIIAEDPTLGKVETIHVTSGGKVVKGNPIITYVNQEVLGQIGDIEGTISDLRAQKSNMIKQGNTSQNEGEPNTPIDTLEIDNQIRSNERQLTNLKNRVRTTINSEIDGVVTIKETGVDGGTETLKTKGKEFYIESDVYVLKGTVTEKDVLKVKEGLESEISFKAVKDVKTGTVKSVSKTPSTNKVESTDPYGSGSTDTAYDVVIELDDQSNILIGFSAQAKIKRDVEAIYVPKEALLKNKGKNKIYTIDGNAIKILSVEVGEEKEGKVEIKTDISGKVIVLNPTKDLKEGETVEYTTN